VCVCVDCPFFPSASRLKSWTKEGQESLHMSVSPAPPPPPPPPPPPASSSSLSSSHPSQFICPNGHSPTRRSHALPSRPLRRNTAPPVLATAAASLNALFAPRRLACLTWRPGPRLASRQVQRPKPGAPHSVQSDFCICVDFCPRWGACSTVYSTAPSPGGRAYPA
jgi:hypothetical protein